MPILQIMLDLHIDGEAVRGFPLNLMQVFDELQQFEYEELNDGNDTTFSTLPVTQIDTVQALLVQALTHAIGVRLEGGEATNVAVRLTARGGILIWGATMTGTNLTVNNNAGATARVGGFGGGT